MFDIQILHVKPSFSSARTVFFMPNITVNSIEVSKSISMYFKLGLRRKVWGVVGYLIFEFVTGLPVSLG